MQSTSAAPLNVIHLRDVLRERFPQARVHVAEGGTPTRQAHTKARAHVSSGSADVRGPWFEAPCLRDLSWQPGSIQEIVSSPPGIGMGLLTLALLEIQTSMRADVKNESRPGLSGKASVAIAEPMALIDCADCFVPHEASPAALAQLLWVRCQEPRQAIRAADLLLRDGNIPHVLLDLYLCPARLVQQIPSTAWHRLRMLAENSGAQLWVFSAFKTVSCARSRLILQPHASPRLEQLDQSRTVLLQQLRGEVQRRHVDDVYQQQPQAPQVAHSS